MKKFAKLSLASWALLTAPGCAMGALTDNDAAADSDVFEELGDADQLDALTPDAAMPDAIPEDAAVVAPADAAADEFKDLCPEDVSKTAPGTCGCGIADADMDSDGLVDCKDACPTGPNLPGVPCGAVPPELGCTYATNGANSYWFCSGAIRTIVQARANCLKSGMDLVKVDDLKENLYLAGQANGNEMWLGLSDERVESSFRWPDGSGGYLNFASGEGRGGRGENCVALRPNGGWFDVSCESRYRYACQAVPECVAIPASGNEVCDGLDNDCDGLTDEAPACAAGCGGTALGDRRYQVCGVSDSAGKKSYPEARATCMSMGATLVRVDDAMENNLVNDFRASEGQLFLGGSDGEQESMWRWPDGMLFWQGGSNGSVQGQLYSNWATGSEPGGGDNEDCAVLRGDGRWQDDGCDSARAFVCEAGY